MTAGYLTDVAYTGDFFPHLAPAWLSYIAMINGYTAPPIDGKFTWCDLGCGKGITSLVLAATHPTGEFHACDFNAAHIEYAEALRRAAGVDNARFHARSFAQMLGEDLPAFDFVTLHGVYSWVPEAVRQEIRTFIRARLKPGGLVMLSYNALPGWAHLQPIRRMMQAHAATVPGDSTEKARAAFAYVSFLAANGAEYFRTSPAAARHLDSIARQDIRYVAHEYLTPHGDPFYFSDVESAMGSIGLAFAGNMAVADNYPDVALPPEFRKLAAAAKTRAALETHRDFIANTSFRQDLYAAQAQPPGVVPLSIERLGSIAFCLTDLSERLPLRQAAPPLRFDLESQRDAVRAIHELLTEAPATAEEIDRVAELGDSTRTAALIQQLVIARHLSPCPPVRATSGWMKVNAALIESALREQQQQVPLACPTTGLASYSEVVHAAAIEAAACCGDAEAAARNVLGQVRRYRHPVDMHTQSGEKRPATDDEVLAYAAATWRSLSDARHPDGRLLRLLGILS